MPLTGYLKLPDIPGESSQQDHEDEIDILSINWGASSPPDQNGGGRTRARPHVSPVTIGKWFDASSPYLALASLQGKRFEEAVISFRKNTGDTRLDFLKITLTNVLVSSYSMNGANGEAGIADEVQLSFETIRVVYTVQAEDHSAGDEHEIEFDIVAGA
jgi:type VI secretion system secreted protein Hcp